MTKIPEETLAHWERERARQRQRRDAMNEWGAKGKNEWGRTSMNEWGDKAPAELVTEEIVMAAAQAFTHRIAWSHDTVESIDVALRAVAPMIAARMSYDDKLRMCDRAVAAEREACAKIMDELEDRWAREWRAGHKADKHLEGKSDGAGEGAAAIRARGAQ